MSRAAAPGFIGDVGSEREALGGLSNDEDDEEEEEGELPEDIFLFFSTVAL
jgi:hypothetical protein